MTPATREQSLASLELANHVRAKRKELKEQLRSRHLNIVSVLLDPPQCCATAQVSDVLRWAPAIGRSRADRALRALRMSASVRLGTIPEARRRQLIDELVKITPTLRREVAS